jgi:hypothetical protein
VPPRAHRDFGRQRFGSEAELTDLLHCATEPVDRRLERWGRSAQLLCLVDIAPSPDHGERPDLSNLERDSRLSVIHHRHEYRQVVAPDLLTKLTDLPPAGYVVRTHRRHDSAADRAANEHNHRDERRHGGDRRGRTGSAWAGLFVVLWAAFQRAWAASPIARRGGSRLSTSLAWSRSGLGDREEPPPRIRGRRARRDGAPVRRARCPFSC